MLEDLRSSTGTSWTESPAADMAPRPEEDPRAPWRKGGPLVPPTKDAPGPRRDPTTDDPEELGKLDTREEGLLAASMELALAMIEAAVLIILRGLAGCCNDRLLGRLLVVGLGDEIVVLGDEQGSDAGLW